MPVLELRSVSKTFRQRGAVPLRAVDDVSLTVDKGECVALVGESGSGKSTLARIALRLIEPDRGDVILQGRSLIGLSAANLRAARLAMQPIFQDPSASFNPRRTVRAILLQAIHARGDASGGDAHEPAGLLERVELRPAESYLERFPHELSGGQRQRLAIARALAPRPELIVADEALSGADVSIRAQILNLLMDLQRQSGVAFLLITHDMLVAQAFSHRVAVMHRGRIVEHGLTGEVLASPRNPYTQRLLAAVQSLDDSPPPVTVPPAEQAAERGAPSPN